MRRELILLGPAQKFGTLARSPTLLRTAWMIRRVQKIHSTAENHSNGPTSTLPAELADPVREPKESSTAFAYRRMKAYSAFYTTGIKNVFSNFKLARSIQSRIKQAHNGDIEDAIKNKNLTRRDYLLLTRGLRDIRKVPLFVLILLTGELAPLLLIMFRNAAPGTCKTPAQRDRLQEKLNIRRANLLPFIEKQLSALDEVDKARLADEASTTTATEVPAILSTPTTKQQLRLISAGLGFHGPIWDHFSFLPLPWLTSKAKLHLKYLSLDDILLKKAGATDSLGVEELRYALIDRGVSTVGKTEEQMRDDLAYWLMARTDYPVSYLLLRNIGVQGQRAQESEETKN